MKIVGMPSFDKLLTLKLLAENTGSNKHLSFTGLNYVQTPKTYSQVTASIDCLDILNDNGNLFLMNDPN